MVPSTWPRPAREIRRHRVRSDDARRVWIGLQLAPHSRTSPFGTQKRVELARALAAGPKHNQAPLPSWAHELDGSRKVVLVTQGTVANHNFDLLVAPTLQALAKEPDLLVVATAGGRPIDAIPGPIPANARLARYLPFEWMLPKADVFVGKAAGESRPRGPWPV
jgi:UDP:flavonoid glycosyltransferase YjiC (YdhE family)